MPVVAIEGRAGSLAPALGRIVAKELDVDFVDRLLLAEIARRVGSTVQALAESERRQVGVVERLASLVQRMLERSAVAGSGGDPYFGPGIETLLARPYRELDEPAVTSSSELGQQQFIDTTREVVRDVAESGSVVILSRGASAILKDEANVFRVGVVADRAIRVRRIMERESLDEDGAEEFVDHSDRAQGAYFEKAFDSSPIDPFLYHVTINTSTISVERAAKFIVPMARELHETGRLA